MRFGFLGATPTAPISSTAIRHERRTKEHQRASLMAARQALAHDELLGDSAAAAKRATLEQQISVLDREVQTLSEALPTALGHERVAREREQERLLAELRQVLSEREEARDALLANLIDALLPTIEDMNALRLLSRECAELQHVLSEHGESFTPVDALAMLRSAVHHRHEEFERRWMRTKPDGRPDFATRRWQKTVHALRTLRERATNASCI